MNKEISMTTDAAIRTVGLTKFYGSARGVEDVDLEVHPGEIFGFLGPNGSGKSTTIRVLLDLIRPTSGRAEVLGMDAQRDSVGVRSAVGYLPGEASFYEELSGIAFLDLVAQVGNRAAGLRMELLERLDLDASRRIARYSRGMKQKLAVVAALQHDPELLILDEPTSGLDPLVQQEFYAILREFSARGRTVFFSSHVLSEVERLCDRVAVIRAGRIVTVDEIAALREKMVRRMTVTFAGPVPAEQIAVAGTTVVETLGSSVTLNVGGGLDALLKRIAGFEVVDLEYERPNLEETFLEMYSADNGEEPA
jgi:ABC-2 type transport system ATP-binding protein